MSSAPFTHLHVASGYSLRYGASSPTTLVDVAAEQGMQALALTDRDGLYGAVKFVQACSQVGIAPLLGVDLAVETGDPGALPSPVAGGWGQAAARTNRRPTGGAAVRRAPVRGGTSVDPRHPRVTVLALGRDDDDGLPAAAGWGRLCELVTATHLRGTRGAPVSSLELVAAHASHAGVPALAVMLGPASELGRAVLARRLDVAHAVLERWRSALPSTAPLVIEVVHHRGPEGAPGSLGHAARMLAVAREAGVPAVLTNAVRHATPDGAVTADVLDAARRLVALDTRHLDRTTAAGYLAGTAEMAGRAVEIAHAFGDESEATRLLADTAAIAGRCRLSPERDVGVGAIRLPEPHVLGLLPDDDANAVLRRRCLEGIDRCYPNAGHRGRRSRQEKHDVEQRLNSELGIVAALDIPTYFLTVGDVCDLIRRRGVRVAARGSGAGSLINHLLGISGVDPLRHGLLMERFLSPLRCQLPDIDIDVEAARRTDMYEAILEKFGGERVTCVSMMDTYRVRHAIRDVGAALGMPPDEIGTIATSFPHIRARDVRHALAELPELQASGLAAGRLDLLFDLVERLDGLPRHVALHPCGVVLSDGDLLRRTPVEASWMGFPMSQFDKDDVEALGLLKLDVLGIRMQSAMAYAVDEVVRVDGAAAAVAGNHPQDAGYLDAEGRIELDAVPLDDEPTFELVRSAHTLGCFQIESPGQRELVGRFAPETFNDLIIDISLFRPGPVKSDMVTPFLQARQGWDEPDYLHPRLRGPLEETRGVVVFHEQVLKIVEIVTGCDLAQADEIRRALGSPEGQAATEDWFRKEAIGNGFDRTSVQRIWKVLVAFASFGFCKAHAAAFALPTYQSAWLKAHHPAAFLAGVLTHDPGMYPKRLILDDARNLGITVLPLDVNVSDAVYRVERVDQADRVGPGVGPGVGPVLEGLPEGVPDGSRYGIRLSLTDVKGISGSEVERIVAGRCYHSLADFWHRAGVTRPVVERLVLTGAFDSLYGLGNSGGDAVPVRRRDRVTRRDLLLQLGELERWTRATRPGRSRSRGGAAVPPSDVSADGSVSGVRAAAARQSQAARPVVPAAAQPVQLALDLGDAPDETIRSGLAEMTGAERVRAELEVLGLDVSRHVLDFYTPLLGALGVTRARQVLGRRNREELLVAGVKVATQTPPIRSGRRVVFLTLDDATGPIDATFFEDVQGPYAATVFHSWLLLVRGELRRTGPRGVSLRATGAWELPMLWQLWSEEGLETVHAVLAEQGHPAATEAAIAGAAASRAARPVMARLPVAAFGGGIIVTPDHQADYDERADAASGLPAGDRDRSVASAGQGAADRAGRAGGMGGGVRHRRVLVHASGFRQSPYADLKPPGEDTRDTRRMLAAEEAADTDPEIRRRRGPPRKLWHASSGSSGR